MSTSPAPRGTYRAEDGTPVEFADALKVWTRIAYERLQQVGGVGAVAHEAVFGGVARIPEQVIVRRERADRAAERTRAAKREDEPQPVCPSCFTQLPASGVCWQCD